MNAKLLTALFALTAFTTACDPAAVVDQVTARAGVSDPSPYPSFTDMDRPTHDPDCAKTKQGCYAPTENR